MIKINEDYDFFNGKKYMVSGSSYTDHGEIDSISKNVLTNDPKAAIEAWFRIGSKHRTGTAITCQKKSDAVALVKWASEHNADVTTMYNKYNCPYKLDYLLTACAKKAKDGCRGFYENSYGDMIYPFDVG